MPERQSSTGEETGRPTTESVGTDGASAGGDHAVPHDAPQADGAGSATAPAGDGTGAAGDAGGTANGTAVAPPASEGGTDAGPAEGGPVVDGTRTDAAGDGAAGGATTDAASTGGATAGTGAGTTAGAADAAPAAPAASSAPATSVPTTSAPADGPTDGDRQDAAETGPAVNGTAPNGAAPNGAAPDSTAPNSADLDGTGPDTATDAASATTAMTTTAATNGTAANGTATDGPEPHGDPGRSGGTAHDAAESPAPRTGSGGSAAAVPGTAPDDAAATVRTSLFEPAVAQRPSSPAGAGAAGDATSTVAIPGRTAGPARGGSDDTVQVARPAPTGSATTTRSAAATGGAAATQAVPLPSSDSESTQVIPLSRVAPHASAPPVDPPTQRLEVQPTAAPPAPPREPVVPGGTGGGRPRRRRPLLAALAVLALLALLYVGDLVASAGSVPRGTTVAGIDVGGRTLADAEQQLRAAIEPRATQPVPVVAGTITSEIDPVAAGLAVDWDGTLAQAGDQPLNPITRIASFFTASNDLGVVTTADDQALTTAIQQLAPVVDTEPVEGTVRFEGTTPVPVEPVAGQRLDSPAAVEVVKSDWASGRPVALPLTELPARTTAEDVAAAVEDVATPAVSGPVTVLGEDDTEGVLEPDDIAQALSFEPGEQGGLVPVLNPTVVTDALEDQLASSEQEPRDAVLNTSTTPPTVVPSQDGRGVDYEATLAALLPALAEDGPREITAVYADQPAELTTEDLAPLSNAGEISRFRTAGFAQDSGINIRRAAELVDGTIVGPGETFSLDEVTGPRTAANGYVEAGVISDGRAGRGIAGGVSQVSTTTYNAAYFAGMTDVEHRAHSFYISRYPEGREATIVTGALDMRFRNDTPTPVLIRTQWTPSDITVIFYGTKYFDVSSETSPRRDFTEPNTVVVPEGEQCTPSQGSPGFTVTVTRTMRNLQTGEVTTEPLTTKYNPAPRVVCGGDDEDD